MCQTFSTGQVMYLTACPTSPRSPPAQGQCWFEFNDTHVSPIMAKQMEKMYQGKQSAYMLSTGRRTCRDQLKVGTAVVCI